MRNIAIIEAPSILGLKPGGVEKLPEALKAQGLLNRIPVVYEEKIIPPSYNPPRDAKTNILNPNAIRDFSVKLADAVQKQQESVTTELPKILNNGIAGFWIHLDADVLDDTIMPAVDYRRSGGLSFEELSNILSILLASQKAIGLSIVIFNPTLDKDGSIALAFVNSIVMGLEEHSK